MATWEEVITNRKDYPDDLKVSINGSDVPLGDLRNTVIPKGDMTKLTERYAQEKRQLEGQTQAMQQQLQALLATQGRQTNQPVTGDELQAYLDDPTFKPIATRLKQALDKVEHLEQRTAEHERTWWANQHLAAINRLKSQDKDLDVNGLLETARQLGTPNLDAAYRHLTYEKAQERAREEGRSKGIEEGKKQAAIPTVPLGRRSTPLRSDPNMPKTFDEAETAAQNDPEIHAIFNGQA